LLCVHLETGVFQAFCRVCLSEVGYRWDRDHRRAGAHVEGDQTSLLDLSATAVRWNRVLFDDLVLRCPAGNGMEVRVEAIAVEEPGGVAGVLPDRIGHGDATGIRRLAGRRGIVGRPREREGHERSDSS